DAELAALPPSLDRSGNLVDLRMMQAVFELDAANLDEARRRLDEARAFAEEADFAPTPGAITRLDIEHEFAWADVLAGDAKAGLERMLQLSREARDANFEGTGVTNYRVTGDVAARVME